MRPGLIVIGGRSRHVCWDWERYVSVYGEGITGYSRTTCFESCLLGRYRGNLPKDLLGRHGNIRITGDEHGKLYVSDSSINSCMYVPTQRDFLNSTMAIADVTVDRKTC